jgi:hypothetical protein
VVSPCPWCSYRHAPCTDEERKKCDFKTLKMDRDAIVERVKKESRVVQRVVAKVKKNGSTDDREVFEAMDRLSGILIMIRVLKERFGMVECEIRKEANLPELSWAEKLQLILKLKSMQKARGGATVEHPNAKIAMLRKGKQGV